MIICAAITRMNIVSGYTVIRDEGAPFNPVESDPGTGLGLMLVRKTCDAERYEYLFHQNILTIEWKI